MSMNPSQLDAALVQIAIAESRASEGKVRAERDAAIAEPSITDRTFQQRLPAFPRPDVQNWNNQGIWGVDPAFSAMPAAAPAQYFSSQLTMQSVRAQPSAQNTSHYHRHHGLLSSSRESHVAYSNANSNQASYSSTDLNTSTAALTKGALELYIKYVQEGQTGTLELQSPIAACHNVRVASLTDANRLLGHLRDVQSESVLNPLQQEMERHRRERANLRRR